MSLADVGADVGHARPRPRSSDKAALEYLEVSGATAISIIETKTGCTFEIGGDSRKGAVVYWLDQVQAESVAQSARKLAGVKADAAAATSALKRAATAHRAGSRRTTSLSNARGTRQAGSLG